MAVKFAVYEMMRGLHSRLHDGRPANVAEDLVMGGVAGAAAAAATTPLDVLKTVMMCSASSRPTIVSAARGIMREGKGLAPFFRGVGPRALSNGLNSAIFFCFFEAIRQVSAGAAAPCPCWSPPAGRLLPVCCWACACSASCLVVSCAGQLGRAAQVTAWDAAFTRLAPCAPPPTLLQQVLIKKQAEAALQQQPGKQQQAAKQQRSLAARLKLRPAPAPSVASTRPQGSPAACLSLALPAPGWEEQ